MKSIHEPAEQHPNFEAGTIRDAARSGAPDRYLAALLSPRAVRQDLIALAAFSAEINRIAHQVYEPYLGEIRMQWWCDALLSRSGDHKSGHPIADAFSNAIERRNLRRASLEGYFQAHVHRLFADPPSSDAQLAQDIDLIEGALFTFAAQIVSAEEGAQHGEILHHAAQCYGLARAGLELPYALARGRNPLPPSMVMGDQPDWRQAVASLAGLAHMHLAHASAAYATQPQSIRTALLPLALVEPYLRALTQPTHDPAHDLADIAPLTRTWRLVKTRVIGRL